MSAVASNIPEIPRKLEIAHVLFMDIIGYSRLPMDYQSNAIAELQTIVAQTPEFVLATTAEQLICLPTGDGMALVFFGDALLPVRCACRLDPTVRGIGKFGIRIGIHSGPVFRIADINANRNVAGGGINVTQRVMDCGDAGHILLSQAVASVLLELSEWRETVHDLGEVTVKHDVVLHIYSLFTNGIGNSNPPTKVKPPLPKGIDGSTLFDPWKPAVPPVFVGRSTLLAKLTDALDEGRSLSLVGDWRIGKSSLLKTCLLRVEKSGRAVRFLNGEGTEGASPSSFVERATGMRNAR